jgi:pimeloyl-ACP methyl ester carboxylesterase
MTADPPTPTTVSVALPDGRRLGYREYGDPEGTPVVSCHGGLLCGLDAAAYDTAAAAAGLRLVSPDRPGLGESTPMPERTTADWAADVIGLLDHLGIERTGVLGWSMGGQYALACAALAPDRVTRAVVVAGALPLDDAETFAQLNAMDRRLTRLAQHHPHVARDVFAALGDVARHRPTAWAHLTERAAPPDESTAIDALPDAGLAHAAAVALTHGDGMVEEYRAWARPWGFAPERVTEPVTVWQGDADTLVPASWGATLAARIPDARLVAVPEAGHFVAFTHTAEVLADLA